MKASEKKVMGLLEKTRIIIQNDMMTKGIEKTRLLSANVVYINKSFIAVSFFFENGIEVTFTSDEVFEIVASKLN